MSASWEFFDMLASRHLGDGCSDAETLAGVRDHMRALPATFWPAQTDTEALERIARLRDAMPPPRTEAETWAMLDEAFGGNVAALALPEPIPPRASPHRRSAGRTGWDADGWLEFDQRFVEAEHAARATFAADPEAVARCFRPRLRPVNGEARLGVEPDTLRRLIRRRERAR